MKAIITPEETWNKLPLDIMDNILETAKKVYGVRFISRETGEELEDMSMRGLFALSIKETLDDAAKQ